MSKYIYPAVFHPGEPDEGGYTVTFPDLPGCISEGDTSTKPCIWRRTPLVDIST